jgi:RNA polymerase sigma factor (sigma-70 family)
MPRLDSVRRLVRQLEAAEQTDLELLEAFAAGRDEAAFAALIERHGPLVWGACQRALGHTQDAEDAFQATFLILARRAGSVRWQADIAGWLYAVAIRVTRKAREQALRRRTLEREAAMFRPQSPAEPLDSELTAALDEEIGRLPDKYRRPIVLCYLQGRTYTEAALLLGWREGTVSGRLARARDLLRRRLVRRGLSPQGSSGERSSSDPLTALSLAALPPGLAQTTIQASLLFTAGRQVASSAAAALAEGVLKTMMTTKFKLLALLSILSALGVGAAFAGGLAREADPPPQPEVRKEPAPRRADGVPDARPQLPRDWAGRWVANPFADTVSFEVSHEGIVTGSRRYTIKDPDSVGRVLRAAKITGVQNGVGVGLVPPARIIAHRKDGSSFEVSLLGEDQVQCREGVIHMDPAFLTALNAQLSKQENRQIDLAKPLAQDMAAVTVPTPVKPSKQSLLAGFTELEVTYKAGGRLHQARITDARTLDALHKELTILAQQPVGQARPELRTVRIVSKDGSTFHGHIVNPVEVFDFDAGRFSLTPAFLKALNLEVSRREGRTIDVTAENPLPEAQARRGADLQKRLAGARSVRFSLHPRGPEQTVTVEKPEDLKVLLARLEVREVPAREAKVERKRPLAELTDRDGRAIKLFLVEACPALDCGPVLCDLVEVSGAGLAWIDNQWQFRLADFVYQKEQQAKGERDRETSRLVCADLPAFWPHVLSVSAHYREGDSELNSSVNAPAARLLVQALAKGKLERLDWKTERWEREVRALFDSGAAALDLTPGLGFSLVAVVAGEKEVLLPDYGRLVFEESPLPAIQKAIDRANPQRVELLPRTKHQ